MKKAFLVSFNPTTRVVVDIEEKNPEDNFSFRDEEDILKIATAARDQMVSRGISNYLNVENIDEITEDEEDPYNEEDGR